MQLSNISSEPPRLNGKYRNYEYQVLVNQLLFRSKIIITSRRPLSAYWQDPRIEFIALDYLSPVADLIEATEVICKNVTHAFFTSYVHVDDFKVLKEKNVPLFTNFLDSLDAVAPNLENVCLQTGGKVCCYPFQGITLANSSSALWCTFGT